MVYVTIRFEAVDNDRVASNFSTAIAGLFGGFTSFHPRDPVPKGY
jgi:hypothetical protein